MFFVCPCVCECVDRQIDGGEVIVAVLVLIRREPTPPLGGGLLWHQSEGVHRKKDRLHLRLGGVARQCTEAHVEDLSRACGSLRIASHSRRHLKHSRKAITANPTIVASDSLLAALVSDVEVQ